MLCAQLLHYNMNILLISSIYITCRYCPTQGCHTTKFIYISFKCTGKVSITLILNITCLLSPTHMMQYVSRFSVLVIWQPYVTQNLVGMMILELHVPCSYVYTSNIDNQQVKKPKKKNKEY